MLKFYALTVFVAWIVLEAVHEALKTKGHPLSSELLEDTKTAIILVFLSFYFAVYYPIVSLDAPKLPNLIGGYILLRIGLLRWIWNIVEGQPYIYIGRSKAYDRALSWFIKKTKQPSVAILTTIEGFAILFGTWLILK